MLSIRPAPLKIGAALVFALSLLQSCSPQAPTSPPPQAKAVIPGQVDDARLQSPEPGNWLAHGGNQQGHRYSPLDQINVETVAKLAPAWSLDLDTYRGQEATPIVVDGIVYVTTAWSKVYAVDAKSGKALWRFDPKVSGPHAAKNCCDVVNRGAAVYRGKVYVATFDGRLVALDAATGRVVWSVATFDPDTMYAISGAPRVGGGLVYIGNAGGEFGGRGFVTAYEADTGKLAWRFYTVPGDPGKPDGAASDAVLASRAQATWFGKYEPWRAGGNVWNSIVYDVELGQLYLATGNGYPWTRTFRSAGKGDNLFIESVVALDAKTGAYRWHYQETPGDIWDYDSVADMILADRTIDGVPRKVLMHSPKNGFFYNLDRVTGALISAEPFVEGINWARGIDGRTGRPIENPAARYDERGKSFVASPGEGGGHAWQPTAFSPKTGLVYLQASSFSSARHVPRSTFEYVKGLDNIGVYHWASHAPGEAAPGDDPDAPEPQNYLLAWDPVAQKAAWKTDGRGSGVMATAGNLVFQGHGRNVVMGELVAYRADTGEKVWSRQTPNAILGGPVSYLVDGEQYVLVTSGAGGGSIIAGTPDVRARQPGRLVAFKLNGSAELPADPPPAGPVVKVDQTWPAQAIEQGKDLYLNRCARCHGFEARSPNILPDLRRSPALADAVVWRTIVEDGTLAGNGMIGWKSFLPPGGSEAIRAFVATEALK
jgi:quinohemoprotein ethanol dehydrogenase